MAAEQNKPSRYRKHTQDEIEHQIVGTNGDDDDCTSSSGPSSSEEDDEDDEEYGISGNGSRHATFTQQNRQTQADTGIKSRLAAFLPQIKRANQELYADDEAQNRVIDDVDDNAQNYIEMNLALGVLTERTDTELQTSPNYGKHETTSESENEDSEDELVSKINEAVTHGNSAKSKHNKIQEL